MRYKEMLGITFSNHSNEFVVHALEGFDMIITKKNEDEIDDRLMDRTIRFGMWKDPCVSRYGGSILKN